MTPAIFLTTILYLIFGGVKYLELEIKSTSSSYGVRRGITQHEYDSAMFVKWFNENEDDLRYQYYENSFENIGFDEYCIAAYTGNLMITFIES